MGVKLVTAPLTYPITVDQAKKHLRVDGTDDDIMIQIYIAAATAAAEAFMGRALVDQTWDLFLDGFPTQDIQIPKPPLIEVVGLFYTDSSSVEQELSFTDYSVDDTDDDFAWIIPAVNVTWPTPIDAANSVRIRFRAGYITNDSPADTNVPFDILAGMYLLIASLFENRENVVVGTIVNKLPYGSENLWRKHRVLLGMA